MAQFNHHLKRLQHSTTSSDYRSSLPNDETIRESIQNFSISTKNKTKFSQPFRPDPYRARRGGGRVPDRNWNSGISIPKRAINYDLAESLMDHSTNPLSSDLYKIRFKHSAKQWPNGRFNNYKEQLDKSDGTTLDITYVRTFPIVPKRKKIQETNQDEQDSINAVSSVVLADPIVQEQKKKLANKQTNFYANLFGDGKISRMPSTTQIKKTNCIGTSTKPSTSMPLVGENKQDHEC